MCGIAGGFLPDSASSTVRLDQAVERMSAHMHRRGPDAQGMWQEVDGSVALGHRRLSIIDVDPRSNQPMASADGRYVLVYNGEIYNFAQLREELMRDGEQFATRSDSEVLLALFARQGEAMLQRLRGMFAFAIWDRQARRLFLARDPYGIKPLYVARAGQGWLFASQVKALLASGIVSRAPDALGQSEFWLLGSVPEPRTWFSDIRALPAGHCLWLDERGAGESRMYWDVGDAWRQAGGSALSDDEVRGHTRDALRASVAAHLVSDVPVGIFLSGGIDSGSLAALMRDAGARDIQGVTIAFDEFRDSADDETPIAAAIAARYGISHHVRRVTRAEFEADWPAIIDAMDQPSVDGVNTWFASKAVAELGLKVVVSGVGGDELFQGYSSFKQLPPLVERWRRLARVPGVGALAALAMAVQARRTGNPRWRLFPDLALTLPGAWLLRRGVFSPAELPALMGPELAAEARVGFDGRALVERMTGTLPEDPRLQLGQIESMTYLRNQLLRDSDWASMAHSVELRTPLVDAWLLRDLQPVLGSFARFPGKSLLHEAPRQGLPRDITQRAKTGFGTPVSRWLSAMPVSENVSPTLPPRMGSSLARRAALACYAP